MKLVTFNVGGYTRLGILGERGILDLAAAYVAIFGDEDVPSWFTSMRSLLSGGDVALRAVREVADGAHKLGSDGLFLNPSDVRFKPPVPDAKKIICVAANYTSHTREVGIKPPDRPYFFGKYTNALVGHGEDVLIPKTSNKVDYEVELAVIIGRRGKYISRREAEKYIAGYTVFNDISFRDKQLPRGWPEEPNPFGQNWIHGKGLDTAAPCGPFLVTRDEVGSPYPLRLVLRVNGEVRQEGSTDEMYHKIYDLIEYLSDGLTLEPGDIIATGTPAGVAAAGKEFLRHGDVIEAEIERIGILRNKIVREG